MVDATTVYMCKALDANCTPRKGIRSLIVSSYFDIAKMPVQALLRTS